MNNSDTFYGWSILGAGAIGCLWAANMFEENIGVNLLLRNDDTLKDYHSKKGITVKSEQSKTYPISAASIESSQQAITHLLVCTKAHHTIAAINSVRHLLSNTCPVVLLQNGMGIAEEVTTLLPNNPLILASTTAGANVSAPFSINKAGTGKTIIGAYQQQHQSLCKTIVKLLPRETNIIEITPHIHGQLWLKLAINGIINPLTAINNVSNGELLTNKRLRQQMVLLSGEISTVAKAFKQNIEQESLFNKASEVAKDTADNISSMLQDIRHQRETEIDNINGYISKLAAQKNISMPINDALVQQIKNLA